MTTAEPEARTEQRTRAEPAKQEARAEQRTRVELAKQGTRAEPAKQVASLEQTVQKTNQSRAEGHQSGADGTEDHHGEADGTGGAEDHQCRIEDLH